MTSRPSGTPSGGFPVVMRGEPHDDSRFTQIGTQIVHEAPPTPVQVRYSLPPDTTTFTGRAPELKRITASTGVGEVVAIHAIGGMPGVGKTALAVHVAHMLRKRFPDRQLFIDLHAHTPGREPVHPADAIAGLLTTTGLDARNLPESMEGRIALWRDRMAGQRALLVLDNAFSTAQVAPLLPGGNSVVLVTSRRYLGDLPGTAVPVLLDALPPDRAREMFVRLAHRAADSPDGVMEAVRLAGFLPLAISLLARVYARHPSWTLANLAAETKASLLTLAAENDTVGVAFEMSYRYLDATVRQFFRHLGCHPAATIDAYAAAALADTTLAKAAGHLDVLHGEGLLVEVGYRRYGMHDLIRRYAHDLAANPAAGHDRALGRLLDYYQHTAALADAALARQSHSNPAVLTKPPAVIPRLPGYTEALAWARAERECLLACLDHVTSTGQRARVVALSHSLASLLRHDGPWADAINRHARAAQSALILGDRIGRAGALNDLGVVRQLAGDYRGAKADLEQALEIYRDLGDRLGQANALSNLGVIPRMAGDYPRAKKILGEALEIYGDFGDRLGRAGALAELVRQPPMGAWPGGLRLGDLRT